ncbi:MAG: AAA family ATPase [Promethearchaeota archaeon]
MSISLIEQQFLLILTGLPAAGKSYLARFMKKALKSTAPNFKVEIVDPDSIRREISSQSFNYEAEHLVRANNLKLIKNALLQENIVISDDLNYYTSMRHDMKEIAEDFHIPFFIIHISTPIEICLKWNNSRGNPIPNEVIHRINEKFDTFDNYNWDKPLASCDLSIINIHETIPLILNQIERKLRDLDVKILNKKNKKKIKQASKDNLEIITRRIVGKLLNNRDFTDLKFRILNLRKKYVKEKKGEINSEDEISRDFIEFLKKRLDIDVT